VLSGQDFIILKIRTPDRDADLAATIRHDSFVQGNAQQELGVYGSTWAIGRE
jgi:hypothetical protein